MGCVTELTQHPHSMRGAEFAPGALVASPDVGCEQAPGAGAQGHPRTSHRADRAAGVSTGQPLPQLQHRVLTQPVNEECFYSDS